MIIITNGLTNTADEGYLKVASSLIKCLKTAKKDCYLISYDRKTSLSDCHLELNKFFFNKELIRLIQKRKEQVLYIPFPTRPLPMALRIFLLSLYSKRKLSVLLVMMGEVNWIAKLLLKISGAKILLLSQKSKEIYTSFLPDCKVKYIKTGVNTGKFLPVDKDTQTNLKLKYGFDPNRPVVLHVGHLNEGRNIRKLLSIDDDYQILLVTSTLTKGEQDNRLKDRLLLRKDLKIMDDYISKIEEVYQMCDVYFFPVVENCRCIDVPLSCLEAASCNKPVVTTNYGEMSSFVGKDGFYFMHNTEKEEINMLLADALQKDCSSREAVLSYDWNCAIDAID